MLAKITLHLGTRVRQESPRIGHRPGPTCRVAEESHEKNPVIHLVSKEDIATKFGDEVKTRLSSAIKTNKNWKRLHLQSDSL